MTLIIDSGNATLILERGIKGADGTLPALVMADITDKKGKVLDDLNELVYFSDLDATLTPGGYIVKKSDNNSLASNALLIAAENGGDTTQVIAAPYLGKFGIRVHDGSSWSSFKFSLSTVDVTNWYDDTTATAADAVINADGSFSREVSTEEWKREIEPMQDSYADAIVQGAVPIYYRSKCKRDPQDWGYWGISAEQLAEIDPRLVHWGHSTKEVPQPRGLPSKTVPDLDSPLKPIGVQYSRIVPALLNVVKRQGAAIDALTARLDALEAKG